MTSGKNRSTLFGVVGGYLIYLAYGLFRDRADTDTTMSPGMRALFIALFAVIGLALIVYAVILWKRASDEEKNGARDDENSMK